jgi:hypothetical protein
MSYSKLQEAFLCLVLLGSEDEQVTDTAGVSPLVIVPRDKLDEVVVERNSSLGVEDRGVGVTDEVGRDDILISVGHDTLIGSQSK